MGSFEGQRSNSKSGKVANKPTHTQKRIHHVLIKAKFGLFLIELLINVAISSICTVKKTQGRKSNRDEERGS